MRGTEVSLHTFRMFISSVGLFQSLFDSQVTCTQAGCFSRRTDRWREQAARLGDDRIRYLSGKRLREYSLEELGKFQIITDVYGGFSYTEYLSQFVDNVLSLLEIGGVFYTLVPGLHLEDGKDKLVILYLTELEDAAGRPEKVCS